MAFKSKVWIPGASHARPAPSTVQMAKGENKQLVKVLVVALRIALYTRLRSKLSSRGRCAPGLCAASQDKHNLKTSA